MNEINYDTDWPYPDVEDRFRAGDKSWREVTEAVYWDQLECLPPIRMNGNAFMVGEPWDSDARGNIYSTFVQVGQRYFCRMDHLIDFDPRLYRHLIRRQLKI